MASFAAELVRRAAAGEQFPRGRSVKTMMYDAFLLDTAAGQRLNELIPPRHIPPQAALREPSPSPDTLRVVCWNVHFWQRGYSGEVSGDNRGEVSAVISQLQPDVILMQELVCPADWLDPPAPGAPHHTQCRCALCPC